MVTSQWRERREVWREKRKVRVFGKGKCKLIANCANFWQRERVNSSPILARQWWRHFRLSLYLSLSLSLSLSLALPHRMYLTHNIGNASALPIIQPASWPLHHPAVDMLSWNLNRRKTSTFRQNGFIRNVTSHSWWSRFGETSNFFLNWHHQRFLEISLGVCQETSFPLNLKSTSVMPGRGVLNCWSCVLSALAIGNHAWSCGSVKAGNKFFTWYVE